MKRCLLLLLCSLLGFAAQALVIGKVSYEAEFPLPPEPLPSSLLSGQEYEPETIQAALDDLLSVLQQSGHPYALIPFPELVPLPGPEPSVELVFRVSEALPADKVTLKFRGLRYFSESKLRDLLLIPEQLPLGMIPELLARVVSLYNDRGYLFASAQVDSLSLAGGLTAHLGISEGKVFRSEKYYFQGNKHTRDATLIKLAALGQSAVVSPSVLAAAEQNILRKSYIRSCQIEPLDPGSVLITVSEGEMSRLEGVLGLNQTAGRTVLNGTLRLQFLNLWGSDRSLALFWRQNPLGNLLELAYHESGPLSFPLAADITLHRMVQDSTWIRSALDLEVYSFHANQNYGLEFAFQGIAPGIRRPVVVEKSGSRSLGAFWRLDSRDRPFAPLAGAQTSLNYRLRHSDTGQTWTSALEADHIQHLGFSSRWSCALGLHLRTLAARDTTSWQQFRLGGYNNLRGYREDEFASWRLGWATLDLRYLINPRAYAYVFYDHGVRVLPSDQLSAALLAPGLGLKVQTRLGTLSLEYALGYRESGFPGFGEGMVHIGLDASF